MPGQLHDLGFTAAWLHGPLAPPTRLGTRIYDGADGVASFSAARDGLARALGAPDEPGLLDPANVRQSVWTFGLASVSLTFWPRELNRDTVYAWPDPLRWKATKLTIVPAWMDALSGGERRELAGADRVEAGFVVPPYAHAYAAYWRRRPRELRDGVAVGPKHVFVVSKRCLVIPRAAVTAVWLLRLVPGRFGGQSDLALALGDDDRIPLLRESGSEALGATAARLGERLGVPVTETTASNDG